MTFVFLQEVCPFIACLLQNPRIGRRIWRRTHACMREEREEGRGVFQVIGNGVLPREVQACSVVVTALLVGQR